MQELSDSVDDVDEMKKEIAELTATVDALQRRLGAGMPTSSPPLRHEAPRSSGQGCVAHNSRFSTSDGMTGTDGEAPGCWSDVFGRESALGDGGDEWPAIAEACVASPVLSPVADAGWAAAASAHARMDPILGAGVPSTPPLQPRARCSSREGGNARPSRSSTHDGVAGAASDLDNDTGKIIESWVADDDGCAIAGFSGVSPVADSGSVVGIAPATRTELAQPQVASWSGAFPMEQEEAIAVDVVVRGTFFCMVPAAVNTHSLRQRSAPPRCRAPLHEPRH